MTIGTFVSSLLVGPLSAKFGRRHGIWFAAGLNAVSTAIMLGTTSVGALYAARLLLGMISSLPKPLDIDNLQEFQSGGSSHSLNFTSKKQLPLIYEELSSASTKSCSLWGPSSERVSTSEHIPSSQNDPTKYLCPFSSLLRLFKQS